MKISTYQFGEIEFTEDRIIEFENGIFGFEGLKKYLLIKQDDDLFFWLNSVEQPEIAFPLVGIRMIDEDYPQKYMYEAFGIVTLNSNPKNITINLKSPVYIRQDDKKGMQEIMENDKYSVNYNLFVE